MRRTCAFSLHGACNYKTFLVLCVADDDDIWSIAEERRSNGRRDVPRWTVRSPNRFVFENVDSVQEALRLNPDQSIQVQIMNVAHVDSIELGLWEELAFAEAVRDEVVIPDGGDLTIGCCIDKFCGLFRGLEDCHLVGQNHGYRPHDEFKKNFVSPEQFAERERGCLLWLRAEAAGKAAKAGVVYGLVGAAAAIWTRLKWCIWSTSACILTSLPRRAEGRTFYSAARWKTLQYLPKRGTVKLSPGW